MEKKNFNYEIGCKLQKARDSKHLSQAQIASYTGLSNGHISTLERGICKISVETLLGYCSATNLTPNDILGISNYNVLPEIDYELDTVPIEIQYKILELIKLIKTNYK